MTFNLGFGAADFLSPLLEWHFCLPRFTYQDVELSQMISLFKGEFEKSFL